MKRVLVAAAIASVSCVSAPATASNFAYAELDGRIGVSASVSGEDTKGALYESGSIGKFACTIAAMRLVDRDALMLDDTLGSLLEDVAATPIATVTLRQVLASRSGIADGLLPAFQSSPSDVMGTPDANAAVRKFALGALAAEPGSEWSYDLVNWIVVQAVIEEVTGRPIADVLADLVLNPAGMGQSRIFVGEIGEGAQKPEAPVRPLPGFLTCAGGLATTPTDLIALARFPHKGGLSASSLRALTTIYTPDEGYTLGGRYIMAGQGTKRLVSWHTGSNGAYKSLVTYDPLTDSGFAAMTASNDSQMIQDARTEWMEIHDLL